MSEPLDALAGSSPVILVGRGGSGTRLLSELALSLGVFLGNRLNISSDSVEWVGDLYALGLQTLGEGIEAESGADHEWRLRLHRRAGAILGEAGLGPDAPWGWKLPETILALPQVLRSFPKARVVHFVRHPVSSAWRRSHVTSRTDSAIGRAVMTGAYRHYGFDPDDIPGDEVWFHNAVTWRYQVEQAQNTLAGHDPARVLLMRYEDLCVAPAASRSQLGRFLGLPDSDAAPALAIDPDRTGSSRPDAETVRKIWDLCGGVAALLAYTDRD